MSHFVQSKGTWGNFNFRDFLSIIPLCHIQDLGHKTPKACEYTKEFDYTTVAYTGQFWIQENHILECTHCALLRMRSLQPKVCKSFVRIFLTRLSSWMWSKRSAATPLSLFTLRRWARASLRMDYSRWSAGEAWKACSTFIKRWWATQRRTNSTSFKSPERIFAEIQVWKYVRLLIFSNLVCQGGWTWASGIDK